MLEACNLTVGKAWAIALGPETLLVGLFVGWAACEVWNWYKKRGRWTTVRVTGIDGSIVPANTRLVSSDGETFFTTRKAVVIGGFVNVPVRKDPLQ